MGNQVILVDKNDNPLGIMPKLEAHKKGLLHRAFSIFVFNSKGEMLIQKRAACKYHTPGLWTNTCCSHPSEGESEEVFLSRRLNEEMGLQIESFQKAFQFIYRAEFDNGLIEHELDHVYYANSDQEPLPNPQEVEEWQYMSPSELRVRISESPQLYTPWFKLLFEPVLAKVPLQTR